MPIRILSDDLINQISAGEVVERPANIVKELIENSIDSKANKIEVLIRGGGLQSIIINDNGKGMHEKELPIAILRYATSKLDKNNLNEIKDFGFRGEALPAISSISKLEITSKTEKNKEASSIEIERGSVITQKPNIRGKGTTVKVTSLFEATPARLKFLKSLRVEIAHCKDVFLKMAISHPKISFKLNVDGKNIYNFKADESNDSISAERISAAFGYDFIQNSIKIKSERNGSKLSGVISFPTFNSSTSTHQYLYVNNRSIKDKNILSLIKVAYFDTIPKGRFPLIVLFLELPASMVDVNVHPSKAEVRFQNEREIKGLIISSIKSAISNIKSQIVYNGDLSSNLIDKTEVYKSNRHENSFDEKVGDINNSYFEKSEKNNFFQSNFSKEITSKPSAKVGDINHYNEMQRYPMGAARAQFHKNYIISETDDGIVIVDQHAAHERIVKEEMLTELKNKKIPAQILLIPEIINLPSSHRDVILENINTLNQLGFEIESFGEDTVLIRAIPNLLNNANISELIKDVAQELFELGTQISIDQKMDNIISTSSCYGSIRSGRELSAEDMNALLRKMEITPNSAQCNHGRPTSISLSLKDIEKLFKRR